MKNKILALLAFAAALPAAAADLSTPVVKPAGSAEIPVSSVTVAKDGSAEYTVGDSKTRARLSKSALDYVWIPKPREVSAAEAESDAGNNARAAELFEKAGVLYGSSGWNVYCILKGAAALRMAGKKQEALAKLDSIRSFKTLNPRQLNDLEDVKLLTAQLCTELGDLKRAEPMLDLLVKDPNPARASAAFLRKGDILRQKDDLRGASVMFMLSAMMFPESPTRDEALSKTGDVLAQLKDKRSSNFYEILRKEYPGSPYTKRLPR